MIELDRVSVLLPGEKDEPTRILSDVSLRIARGSWVAVAGPNGSGKTTLLKTIAGLIEPSEGGVVLDRSKGQRVTFSIMFQDPDDQFVAGSVRGELLLSASRGAKRSHDRSDLERRVANALELFSLEGMEKRNPHRLSGGEKQRLALASVWLEGPDVLLLDEPFSFMDWESRKCSLSFLRDLAYRGVTIVWATLGGEELLLADELICLDEGSVTYRGSPQRFLAGGGADRFGVLRPRLFAFAGEVLQELLDRSKADGVSRVVSRNAQEVAVEACSLSFAYLPGKAVLSDVSFDVRGGECVGVAGRSGSGKTTLLDLISGTVKPDSGEIRFREGSSAIAGDGPGEESSNERGERPPVFYLFQSPERMFFAETIIDEVTFGLKAAGVPSKDLFSHAKHALGAVGMEAELVAGRSPFTLSFGEMRRLALAIAFSLDAGLLLLDEPSAGLDGSGLRLLRASIDRWCSQHRGVVVASHDLDFLLESCDRVLFIEGGRIERSVKIEGGKIVPPQWSYEYKPFVIDFKERLEGAGLKPGPPVASIDLLARRLFHDAESDVS